MRITTAVKISNRETSAETHGIETLPNKAAFMKFVSDCYETQKNAPELSITFRLIRITK
jgi:hypothetical protein